MLKTESRREIRQKLAAWLPDQSLFVSHSGEEMESSRDDVFPFEVNRNFFYLTGIDSPDAIYVMLKRNQNIRELLFVHIPTPMEQRWMNRHFDAEAVKKDTGISGLYPRESFDEMLSRLMFRGDIESLYVDVSRYDATRPLNTAQLIAGKLLQEYPYLSMHNAFPFIAKQRTIKYPEEIEDHRKAVEITELGVKNMLAHMKPGMKEYEIEAYYDFVLRSHGVKIPAFTTIAAAGANANHMHYMDNDAVTKDGDLILFDLGARWNYYCADVSRTYPVNGRFTERQKQLYHAVLLGLKAAEDASKPGVVKDDLQNLSRHVMAEELIRIGKISREEEIAKYYMHGSGHTIGLDTHDAGDYDLLLEKDMMFTLEPGLYFDDEGMGIRIEDTLLVTDTDVEILSAGIPKEIDEIEAYMREHHD